VNLIVILQFVKTNLAFPWKCLAERSEMYSLKGNQSRDVEEETNQLGKGPSIFWLSDGKKSPMKFLAQNDQICTFNKGLKLAHFKKGLQ
jgi:hypothetical protein